MKEFRFTLDEINNLVPKLQGDIARNKLMSESLRKTITIEDIKLKV
jgi:hypothetical protein